MASLTAQPPNDPEEDQDRPPRGPWFASWVVKVLITLPPVLIAVGEVIYQIRH